jgi:hypothetical protein
VDNQKRIASLAKELDVLRRRHANHERSVAELERLGSGQARLIAASRDKVAAKIANIDSRIAALQDEPEDTPIVEGPMPDIESISAPIVNPAPSKPTERTNEQIRRDIRTNAAACDEHAAALAVAVRALHVDITEIRQRQNRGPSSAIVTSALERAAAKHFTGTLLRSTRSPCPRPAQGGFASQVEIWWPLLLPPQTPPPPPPMSPATVAALGG